MSFVQQQLGNVWATATYQHYDNDAMIAGKPIHPAAPISIATPSHSPIGPIRSVINRSHAKDIASLKRRRRSSSSGHVLLTPEPNEVDVQSHSHPFQSQQSPLHQSDTIQSQDQQNHYLQPMPLLFSFDDQPQHDSPMLMPLDLHFPKQYQKQMLRPRPSSTQFNADSRHSWACSSVTLSAETGLAVLDPFVSDYLRESSGCGGYIDACHSTNQVGFDDQKELNLDLQDPSTPTTAVDSMNALDCAEMLNTVHSIGTVDSRDTLDDTLLLLQTAPPTLALFQTLNLNNDSNCIHSDMDQKPTQFLMATANSIDQQNPVNVADESSGCCNSELCAGNMTAQEFARAVGIEILASCDDEDDMLRETASQLSSSRTLYQHVESSIHSTSPIDSATMSFLPSPQSSNQYLTVSSNSISTLTTSPRLAHSDYHLSVTSQLSISSNRSSKYSSGPRLDMSIFEPPPHLMVQTPPTHSGSDMRPLVSLNTVPAGSFFHTSPPASCSTLSPSAYAGSARLGTPLKPATPWLTTTSSESPLPEKNTNKSIEQLNINTTTNSNTTVGIRRGLRRLHPSVITPTDCSSLSGTDSDNDPSTPTKAPLPRRGFRHNYTKSCAPSRSSMALSPLIGSPSSPSLQQELGSEDSQSELPSNFMMFSGIMPNQTVIPPSHRKPSLGHLRRHSDGTDAFSSSTRQSSSVGKSPLSMLDEFAQIHQKGRFTVTREQSSYWRPLQRRTISRFSLVDECIADEDEKEVSSVCVDSHNDGNKNVENELGRPSRFRYGTQ
ncbi:hypothetical protein MT418_005260 [Batrachochytrium dendrobatidis]